MSTTLLTALVSILGAAIASGGMWAYLQSRRTTSGQIGTTAAETLWAQMQAILQSTQQRADKAEQQRDALVEQRDKLLAGYAEFGPMLVSINSSLSRLLELLATQEE